MLRRGWGASVSWDIVEDGLQLVVDVVLRRKLFAVRERYPSPCVTRQNALVSTCLTYM